ncbi:MAG: alpha/beta hydrolase, partial [Alphaproteobacteria bacterium]|nr:alpha/beta hydrolase [Alphaproteobacteria bacterium]
MKRAVKAMLMTVGVSGCSGLDLLDAVTPTGGYTVDTDIPYGDGARQRLDV